MIEINKVYNMDCMDGLRRIESSSISHVVTDPPYGIAFQSARRIETERFDKIENDGQPFVWWLHDAYRVLKEGGSLICFCRWDVQEAFAQAIKWAGFELKSQIIWDREVHGLGDLKAQFSPRHDIIWFAIKGKFEFKNGRPASVIRSMRVAPDKMLHPTEKPLDLMRQLIEKVSVEGDLILDPFMGSGATAKACKELNRQFIGFELNPDYVKIAEERLKQQVLLSTLN